MDILKNLLKVRSILTLATCFVFCYLALKGTITADQFMIIFTSIVTFYFGTKVGEKIAEKKAAALQQATTEEEANNE